MCCGAASLSWVLMLSPMTLLSAHNCLRRITIYNLQSMSLWNSYTQHVTTSMFDVSFLAKFRCHLLRKQCSSDAGTNGWWAGCHERGKRSRVCMHNNCAYFLFTFVIYVINAQMGDEQGVMKEVSAPVFLCTIIIYMYMLYAQMGAMKGACVSIHKRCNSYTKAVVGAAHTA